MARLQLPGTANFAKILSRLRYGKDPGHNLTRKYPGTPEATLCLDGLNYIPKGIAPRIYDCIHISDLRFPGGTSQSNSTELQVQAAAGLRSGVFHVASSIIAERKSPIAPVMRQCFADGIADLLSPDAKVTSKVVILRHPTCINLLENLPENLTASQFIVVINHPARSPKGGIEYDIESAISLVERRYGVTPKIAPISEMIRDACQFDGETADTWYNIFLDHGEAATLRSTNTGRLVIGRHTRDAREKWPDNGNLIRAIYPSDPNFEIRVLGGAKVARKLLGSLPANWTVFEFDEVPVHTYLDSIDVYVYFHSASWTEAFGRSIAEAVGRGIPTILPHHFEALYGDACLYCDPADVRSLLHKLLINPSLRHEVGKRGRQRILDRFSPSVHLRRLLQLGCGN